MCAAGADYIELDTLLVFDEGLATTQCVYIPVLNDECLEYESESFYISLSSEQDCVRFSNDSYEAYIIDDDCEYDSTIILCVVVVRPKVYNV